MKLSTRIRQSEVAFRSGARLALLFASGALVAWWTRVLWLAKLAAGAALLFVAGSCLEYWNVWRLRRRAARPDTT